MEASNSPAESSVSSSIREDSSSRPKRQRRTFLTHYACNRCRQKKSKCDGRRPLCGRCEKNNADCVFDVAQEGITRMQNLQQLLVESNERYEHVMILIEAFRTASDDTATNLLARLRLGETITSLVSSLSDSDFARQSGDMTDGYDARERQNSTSTNTWPPSPIDTRVWTSWSTRDEPEQQDVLQPQDPRLHVPRSPTSLRSPGYIVPNPRSPGQMDSIMDGAGPYSQQYHYNQRQPQMPHVGSTQGDHEQMDGVDSVSDDNSHSSEGKSSRKSPSGMKQQPRSTTPRRSAGRGGVR